MPGPLIIRLIEGPVGDQLVKHGRAALVMRYGLEPGTPVRIWVEEHAKWVDAVVTEKHRVSHDVLSRLVELSGYGSVEEWVESVERMNKGSLPGWVFVVERVGLE
ncbi:MAG: hypothetical protein F7C37_01695 [Desulfurococcales archaeon]|nr:hypothetical protein [Desulfurococcales archaeon]